MPFLIDKLLGAAAGITTAVLCLLIGMTFLVAGHLHRDKVVVRRRGNMATIGLFILLGALLGGITGSILVLARKLPTTVPDASVKQAAYSVAAENSFPEPSSDVLENSALWETTRMDINGKLQSIRSPINAMVYFRIVNLQSNAAVISNFSIEVMTTEGWKKVIYWTQGPIWFAPSAEFNKATELRPATPMLDSLLRSRAIGPKETVRGWLPIIYPRTNALISNRIFRITIADTLGGHVTVETGEVPVGNFTDSAFTVGGKKDISGYKSIFIQDLPGYWK
jgi:hypothetical protein